MALLECGQNQVAQEFLPEDVIKVMDLIGLDMTVSQAAVVENRHVAPPQLFSAPSQVWAGR
jgi:hypothetical protein